MLYSILFYYIIFYSIVLCYIILYYIMLYCIVLYYIVWCYITLCYFILYYTLYIYIFGLKPPTNHSWPTGLHPPLARGGKGGLMDKPTTRRRCWTIRCQITRCEWGGPKGWDRWSFGRNVMVKKNIRRVCWCVDAYFWMVFAASLIWAICVVWQKNWKLSHIHVVWPSKKNTAYSTCHWTMCFSFETLLTFYDSMSNGDVGWMILPVSTGPWSSCNTWLWHGVMGHHFQNHFWRISGPFWDMFHGSVRHFKASPFCQLNAFPYKVVPQFGIAKLVQITPISRTGLWQI